MTLPFAEDDVDLLLVVCVELVAADMADDAPEVLAGDGFGPEGSRVLPKRSEPARWNMVGILKCFRGNIVG